MSSYLIEVRAARGFSKPLQTLMREILERQKKSKTKVLNVAGSRARMTVDAYKYMQQAFEDARGITVTLIAVDGGIPSDVIEDCTPLSDDYNRLLRAVTFGELLTEDEEAA